MRLQPRRLSLTALLCSVTNKKAPFAHVCTCIDDLNCFVRHPRRWEQHPPKSPHGRRTQDHRQAAKHRPRNLILPPSRFYFTALLQHASIRGALPHPDFSPLLSGWDESSEQQRRHQHSPGELTLVHASRRRLAVQLRIIVAIEHLAASWHSCEER